MGVFTALESQVNKSDHRSKHYHEPDEKWRPIGRAHGGWWKCRSRKDGNDDVPLREHTCKECHRPDSPQKIKQHKAHLEEKEKYLRMKDVIPQAVKNLVKAQMAKDRAFVRAMLKSQGA